MKTKIVQWLKRSKTNKPREVNLPPPQTVQIPAISTPPLLIPVLAKPPSKPPSILDELLLEQLDSLITNDPSGIVRQYLGLTWSATPLVYTNVSAITVVNDTVIIGTAEGYLYHHYLDNPICHRRLLHGTITNLIPLPDNMMGVTVNGDYLG